jgi:hypothetical protein
MELWLEAEVARAVHTADMAVLRVLARRDLPDSDYLMVPLPWAKSTVRQISLIWSPKLAKAGEDVMGAAIEAPRSTWQVK